MARRDQLVPDLLSWVALKDGKENLHQVKYNDTPNRKLNCHAQWQIPLAGRVEDPGVLEENRELHEDVKQIVEDYLDVEPLL